MAQELNFDGRNIGTIEGEMECDCYLEETITGDSHIGIKAKSKNGETLNVIIDARKLAKVITPYIDLEMNRRTMKKLRTRGGAI